MSLKEVMEWCNNLRREGKKLVVTNGCFDILHRGHVEYLKQAAALGDHLLVLVNSDASVKAIKGESRPINNENDRAYLLESLKVVDKVLIFSNNDCTAELDSLKPDIYVKGGDYTLETINQMEREVLEKNNTKIVFVPFVYGHSTTTLIEKMKEMK